VMGLYGSVETIFAVFPGNDGPLACPPIGILSSGPIRGAFHSASSEWRLHRLDFRSGGLLDQTPCIFEVTVDGFDSVIDTFLGTNSLT